MNIRSLVLLATLLTPASLLATPVTYTYTGAPFSLSADVPFLPSDYVTGTLTLSAPLGDNLNDATVDVTSFSFTDDATIFTQTNNPQGNFQFSTDASGQITDWTIDLGGKGNQIDSYGPLSGGYDYVATNDYGSTAFTAAAGTFTLSSDQISATPEPSSLILLGTGALALAGAARRRLTTR